MYLEWLKLEEYEKKIGEAVGMSIFRDAQARRDNIDYNFEILTWLYLKIDLECQVLQDAYKIKDEIKIKSYIVSDVDRVFHYAKRCEHKEDLSREVVADAIELILSIVEIEEFWLKFYSNSSGYVNRSDREHFGVSADMFDLFVSVAKQLLKIKKSKSLHVDAAETAYKIIEKLCTLSRERNDLTLHKELVMRAIANDYGTPFITEWLFEINEESFSDDHTDYAGNFYWAYACFLWENGNNDKAKICFEKCHSIRKALYVKEDWLTALAGRNADFIDYTSTKSTRARDSLVEFIFDIEKNKYKDMPERKKIQAETICSLLMVHAGDASIPEFGQYEVLLDIYDRLCDELAGIGDGRISRRLAWNFRGAYYLKTRDYMSAENAFKNALKATENPEAVSILSDEQIRTNLMVAACAQNDFVYIDSILSKLSDDTELNLRDMLRMDVSMISFYLQNGIEMDKDELRTFKNLADDLCKVIISKDEKLEDITVAVMYLASLAVYFLWLDYADKDELKSYLQALDTIYENEIYGLSGVQRRIIALVEAQLAAGMRLPEEKEYIEKMLRGLEGADLWSPEAAVIYQVAASYFEKNSAHGDAIEYTEKAKAGLSVMWHRYVKYVNDTRLINILSPIQQQYAYLHAICRRYVSVEEAYECVLQFKMLASLVGRERNRIIHSMDMDDELLKKIRALQDKIAESEAGNIFMEDTADYESQAESLRKLEYEFAEKFPSGAEFKEITWQLVAEAIPDNSAVLEYYFTVDDFLRVGVTDEELDELAVFELYFVQKRAGKTSLKRFDISNAQNVYEKAEQLIDIYQEKSENADGSENERLLEDLRYDLYKALIKPVIDEIGENTTVYFAPDSYLVNLPFELLYEDENIWESHQVVRIECARDFLFVSPDTAYGGGKLVIGNPAYFVDDIDEKEIIRDDKIESEHVRGIGVDLMEIEQLQFSEVESKRVSGYLSASPCIGRLATKDKLLSADRCRNIHIATHGFFDLSAETDSIYSSSLMLAGVKNWVKNSAISSSYGNGVVTADEISRLDFKGTELVVLSSCLSGRKDEIMQKGFHGMTGAFAAAGVKYVIANLWNVPETLGTVILMDAFYYYYIKEKMDPPVALAKAKIYLRNLTIREMKEKGWFYSDVTSDLDESSRESMAELEGYDDRFRPYKDEMFWGGFSCYRCN